MIHTCARSTRARLFAAWQGPSCCSASSTDPHRLTHSCLPPPSLRIGALLRPLQPGCGKVGRRSRVAWVGGAAAVAPHAFSCALVLVPRVVPQSSTIFAIAGHFNLPVCCCDFGSPQMSDKTLNRLLNSAPNPCILLFEVCPVDVAAQSAFDVCVVHSVSVVAVQEIDTAFRRKSDTPDTSRVPPWMRGMATQPSTDGDDSDDESSGDEGDNGVAESKASGPPPPRDGADARARTASAGADPSDASGESKGVPGGDGEGDDGDNNKRPPRQPTAYDRAKAVLHQWLAQKAAHDKGGAAPSNTAAGSHTPAPPAPTPPPTAGARGVPGVPASVLALMADANRLRPPSAGGPPRGAPPARSAPGTTEARASAGADSGPGGDDGDSVTFTPAQFTTEVGTQLVNAVLQAEREEPAAEASEATSDAPPVRPLSRTERWHSVLSQHGWSTGTWHCAVPVLQTPPRC